MKYKKTQLALLSILLVALVFCVFFKIVKIPYKSSNMMARISLVLNKVIKHEVIYPTELLSVDLDQKTATIRVKFPEEGWKEFKGREKEKFEGVGYYIDGISNDKVNIIVLFPESDYHYRLQYRWK